MIMVIRIVIMVFIIISPITLGVIFGFCGRKEIYLSKMCEAAKKRDDVSSFQTYFSKWV